MKNAQQYFDNHEDTDVLYFTSDNHAFFEEQNAINHSQTLDDNIITAMTRDEAYADVANLTDDEWAADMEELLDELDPE